jgi:hypothetical protein
MFVTTPGVVRIIGLSPEKRGSSKSSEELIIFNVV